MPISEGTCENLNKVSLGQTFLSSNVVASRVLFLVKKLSLLKVLKAFGKIPRYDNPSRNKYNHYGRHRDGSEKHFNEVGEKAKQYEFLINHYERFRYEKIYFIALEYLDGSTLERYINDHLTEKINFAKQFISNANTDQSKTQKISLIIFWFSCIIIAIYSFIKNFSLIPLLGLTSCLYLLTGMTKTNWAWFLSWLAIGLIVYFIYGMKNSKLAK